MGNLKPACVKLEYENTATTDFYYHLLSRFTKGNESKNRPELPDDCMNFTVWVEWTFSGWLMAVHWGHGANLTRNSMNKHSEPRWPLHNWGWSSAGDAARGSICDKRSTDSQKMLVSADETVFSQCLTSKICFHHSQHRSSWPSTTAWKPPAIWLVNRIAVFCYVSSDHH